MFSPRIPVLFFMTTSAVKCLQIFDSCHETPDRPIKLSHPLIDVPCPSNSLLPRFLKSMENILDASNFFYFSRQSPSSKFLTLLWASFMMTDYNLQIYTSHFLFTCSESTSPYETFHSVQLKISYIKFL